MRVTRKFLHFAVLLSLTCAYTQAHSDDLKDPSAFSSISDKAERSRALFTEVGKVLQSPRCLNCHPRGDTPTQGSDMHIHYPSLTRGPKDRGVVGMMCTTCHQEKNPELAKIPGAPNWHLAPKSMAWVGKNLHEICVLLKDPKRNGNRDVAQITEHVAHDPLVGWGWHPGSDRTPAPGTQAQAGALISAWVETGAECPESN